MFSCIGNAMCIGIQEVGSSRSEPCLQEELVRSYNLPFEVVGKKSETRLRISREALLPEMRSGS